MPATVPKIQHADPAGQLARFADEVRPLSPCG
jgi:hypothetical protein